jgi:hypothetical protein
MIYQSNFLGHRDPPSEVDGEQFKILSAQNESKNNPLHKFNPLNTELNPICPLLALFGAHHILHVSR